MKVILQLITAAVIAVGCSKDDEAKYQTYKGKYIINYDFEPAGCRPRISIDFLNSGNKVNTTIWRFISFRDTVAVGDKIRLTMSMDNCVPDFDPYIEVSRTNSMTGKDERIYRQTEYSGLYGSMYFVIEEQLTEQILNNK